MKPLHEIRYVPGTTSNKQSYTYIQVKNGYVTVTNGFVLLRLPADEVFGENIIAEDDELYFLAKEWGDLKIHTAFSFTRKGFQFIALSKRGKTIGEITALSFDSFLGKADLFPDADLVIPKASAARIKRELVSFHPGLLNDLCTAFEVEPVSFRLIFYQPNTIVVKSYRSEGVGIIMPLHVEDDSKETKQDSDQDKDDEILLNAIQGEEEIDELLQ